MNTRLELTWLGKYDPENKISPEPRILIENPAYSYRREGTMDNGQLTMEDDGNPPLYDNLLIHGDNLLALKSLEQEYAGRVKCIYIDPPYNTGSAFEHYDDNLEHSTWLSLMKPRLELLRNLLSEDGSIWISIDDDEQAYLKVLCDEVFGRPNYIASIVWQKRTSPDMRAVISDGHDYILVYAVNKDRFKEVINRLPLNEEQAKSYKNPDNDPRGPWTSTDATAQAGHGTKDQFYTLTTPAGRVIELPNSLCWRFTKKRMEEEIAAGRIWFGKDGNGVPRKKTYLSESQGVVPWSWWTNKEVGHNQEAKKEIIALFGATNVFDTPKPERLIQRILQIATNPGDLVLDSFLGSGTTAAVAHKMGRRWIGVELGDHATTHCAPRLKKVIDGEQGGISKAVGWKGGGFRFCELAPSLLQKDKFGRLVISEHYNAQMLAAAMAKHEGYTYCPDPQYMWKQGASGDKNYIFTTTQFIDAEYLGYITGELPEDEYLLICAEDFAPGCDRDFPNITVRPIPKILLGRCEFGRDNYDLNVILQDEDEWEDEDIVNAASSQCDANEEEGIQNEKNGQ